MTTETTKAPEPEPRYERFCLAYPSGTVVDTPIYCDGATLGEVRVTHPLAVVEAVEDSFRRFARAGGDQGLPHASKAV